MAQKVVAYARVSDGDRERLIELLRQFAEVNDLDISEEFIDEGHTAEAWATAFRQLTTSKCSLLIPHLSALGSSQREVRGRLAGLRAAGIEIYEAEGGMHITWTVGQVETGRRQPRERHVG